MKEFRSKLDNKTIADFEEDGQLNIEEVIRIYHAYIASILRNCMSRQEDMEEVMADVFVILWKNYERLDKTMEVKPYLVGILKNLVRKKYRVLHLESGLEDIDDFENQISSYIEIGDLAEENEKSKIVADEMEEIKAEEKQIFMMFYYRGKKIKEISKELQVSEAKVKVILHRLRKRIRKKLKERGYDYGKS